MRSLVLAAAARAAEPMPVTAAAPPIATHFELGRAAYERGEYERSFNELMLALVDNQQPQVRDYLERAGEKLLERQRQRVAFEHGALLKLHAGALDEAKVTARRWNVWLGDAQGAARLGRWAAAFDGFRRVLEDNPLHDDALEGLKKAQRGVAAAVAAGRFKGDKDRLTYLGLLAAFKGELGAAADRLEAALAVAREAAELDNERIHHHLAHLAQLSAPAPALAAETESAQSATGSAPPVAVPVQPEASRPPAPAKPSARARARVARSKAAIPQAGEWALAQGRLKLEQGRLAEAVDLLERAAGEAPGNAEAARSLAEAKQALALARAREREEARRLYSAGMLLYTQGRIKEAVLQWRQAAAKDPGHEYAARALEHAETELRLGSSR